MDRKQVDSCQRGGCVGLGKKGEGVKQKTNKQTSKTSPSQKTSHKQTTVW